MVARSKKAAYFAHLEQCLTDYPRAFLVDNGLAFGGIANPKIVLGIGDDQDWSDPLWTRYPRDTIERFRRLDAARLDSLATVAEFEQRGDQLVPVAPTAPIDPEEGVRFEGGRVQFGLTTEEIQDLKTRLAELLERVDTGELAVF